MATKIKGLQMWCKKMTEGYSNVDVVNFTSSWRDGLAFCAIIHRFRPDLIDFDSLDPSNVLENNRMAFEIAEKELDIPAFLEAEDMARLKVPDKLSVITYVSQYYNYLHALPQLGGPGVKSKNLKMSQAAKRPLENDTAQSPSTKKSATDVKENIPQVKERGMGDKCSICEKKVYLLERHIEAGKLYHRSCYRHSEMSPTSKVYTRSPFMSPSLSTEKAPSSIITPLHNETTREKDSKKHPLLETDRSDTKKSKVEEISLPKTGIENIKPKKDLSSVFPLTSKEAKRLERRKEELFSSEKSKPENISKRNVPLVLRSDSSKNVQDLKQSKKTEADSKLSLNNLSKTKSEFRSNSSQLSKSQNKLTQESNIHSKLKLQNNSDANSYTKSESNLTSDSQKNLEPKSLLNSLKSFESKIKATKAKHKQDENVSSELEAARQRLKSKNDVIRCQEKTDTDILNKEKKLQSFESDKTKPKTQLLDKAPDSGVQRLQNLFSEKQENSESRIAPVPKTRTIGTKIKTSVQSNSQLRESKSVSTVPKPAPRKSFLENSIISEHAFETQSRKKESSGENSELVHNISSNPPPLPKSNPPALSSNTAVGDVQLHEDKLDLNKQITMSIIEEDVENSKTLLYKEHIKTSNNNSASNSSKDLPKKETVEESNLLPGESSSNVKKQMSSPECRSPNNPSIVTDLLSSLKSSVQRSSSAPIVPFSGFEFKPLCPTASLNSSETSSADMVTAHSQSSSEYKTCSERTSINTSITSQSTLKGVDGVKQNKFASANSNFTVYKDTSNESNNSSTIDADLLLKENQRDVFKSEKNKFADSSELSTVSFDQRNTFVAKDRKNAKDLNSKTKIKTGSVSCVAPKRAVTVNPKSSNISELLPSNLKSVSNSDATKRNDSDQTNNSTVPEALSVLSTLRHVSTQDETHNKTKNTSSSLSDIEINSGIKKNKTNTFIQASKSADAAIDEGIKRENKNMCNGESLNFFEEEEEEEEFSRTQNALKNLKLKREAQKENSNDCAVNGSNKLNGKNILKNRSFIDEEANNKSERSVFGKLKSERENRSTSTDSKDTQSRNLTKPSPINEVNKTERSLSNEEEISKIKLRHVKDADKPARPRSENVLDKAYNTDVISKHNTKSSNTIPNKTSLHATKQILNSLQSSKTNKLDWQKEAERKIAAFSVKENKFFSCDSENVKSNHSNQDKPQRTLPEPSVSKQAIIKTLKEKPRLTEDGPRSKNVEDFREKLKNLKHININNNSNGESLGSSKKEQSRSDQEMNSKIDVGSGYSVDLDKLGRNTTKSLSKIGVNTSSMLTDGNPTPDSHNGSPIHIDNDVMKETFIETPSSSDSETRYSPTSSHLHTTPKLKRKITVLGRNKKGILESPPPSPDQMKKIEVGLNLLDFDSTSTDVESSNSNHSSIKSRTPPARPPPPNVEPHTPVSPRKISPIELQQQLLDIDSRLNDLELRGRNLEDSIRNVTTLEEEDDSMMMEWFQLVSDKNDLVRKEADLVYLSREQDLEDEQDHLENQLQYLINKPEICKSPQEKEEETYLLQRKIDIVNQRSCIVDSMDEDRLRYEKEDKEIEGMLKHKGLWKDNGTMKALKGKKTGKSKFFI